MKNYKVIFCSLLILAMAYLLGNNASYTAKADDYSPAMSEGQLREMYYGADRQLMQCAKGSCDNEQEENLKAKRNAAQDGLSIHYNYKYVGGEFIKKPRD